MNNVSRETWKPVVGFSDHYDVSSHGRIRTKHRNQGIKKPKYDPDGYLMIDLWDKTRFHTKKIHRLILEAFVGPCPANHLCFHINNIRDDNRVPNLRWATAKENTQHMLAAGRHRVKSKLNFSSVAKIRSMLDGGERTAAIAKRFKVCDETIRLIKVGKSWKTFRLK